MTSNSSANDLALPGFTGSIRTPNANIAPLGRFEYQFNNYNDLNSSSDNTYNHVFAVGLNAYIEVGGRLTNWYNDNRVTNTNGTLPGKRDLSGNLKFRTPKIHRLLPDIAFGVQDFAGEAVNFRSTYGVASKTFGKTTVSLGYAKSDTSALNGEFASLDIKLSPDLALKADYLNKTFAVGLDINANRITRLPLSLQISGEKQEDGDWNELLGLTLSLPLDKKLRLSSQQPTNLKLASQERSISKFIQSLESHGLSHSKLGHLSNTDIIFVENNVYNHSYLDALSVVLGNAYKHLGGRNSVRVVLSKQNIPLLAVQVSMHEYGKHINGQPSTLHATTRAWLPAKNSLRKVNWVASTKSAKRSPINIRLQPELNTNLGSEWGVFDYSAALRADIKIPLGRIADFVISGSIPIANSDLYDDGNAFANRRHESKINHAVIQKLIKPRTSTVVLASGGYSTINNDEYILGQIEGLHNISASKNQIFAKAAYFNNKNSARSDELIAVVGLKRHIDFLDIDAEVNYGQFYNEDRGVKIKTSKFYGDTQLSAEIKYIDTDDISGLLSISLPLTPRKDKLLGNTVVRASQSWKYGIETTIKDPIVVGSNRVRPNFMLDPSLSYTLEKDYLDNNRISPDHFMNNLSQTRERSSDLLVE